MGLPAAGQVMRPCVRGQRGRFHLCCRGPGSQVVAIGVAAARRCMLPFDRCKQWDAQTVQLTTTAATGGYRRRGGLAVQEGRLGRVAGGAALSSSVSTPTCRGRQRACVCGSSSSSPVAVVMSSRPRGVESACNVWLRRRRGMILEVKKLPPLAAATAVVRRARAHRSDRTRHGSSSGLRTAAVFRPPGPGSASTLPASPTYV